MSTYPDIVAGQEITAELLRAMLPQTVWKTASTDRAATTTFADDEDLTMQLEASATYIVEFHLLYAALSAADFKTAWTVPSGAGGNRSAMGPGSTAADADADNITMRSGVHNYTTSVTYSGVRNSATNLAIAVETATLTTSSAGTLALQWAQATSNATATRLATGSRLRVWRIA